MVPGLLNFVVGGQFGSEGKGKIAGYLAKNYNVDYSICSFSSQAGHTYLDDDGNKFVFRQVPVAAVNKSTKLLISQGAIIDVDVLKEEIDLLKLNENRLRIHPKAIVIKQEHKDKECQMKDGPMHIASTCKGNGAAMADFVFRNKEVKYISEFPEFKSMMGDTRAIINSALDAGAMCMSETAQGYSLDIYQGFYPHVTSRGCTPAAELARIGVSQQKVGRVYGCYRTYPIRVGNIDSDNTRLGYSGDGYSDQQETTWEEVTKASGSKVAILERTTVTNRIRRVFNFSREQLLESMNVMGVTDVCLMFADYIAASDFGKKTMSALHPNTERFIETVRMCFDDIMLPTYPRVSIISTGPAHGHTVDLDEHNPSVRVGGTFWTKKNILPW
jgi:adenylosuccinate synthase